MITQETKDCQRSVEVTPRVHLVAKGKESERQIWKKGLTVQVKWAGQKETQEKGPDSKGSRLGRKTMVAELAQSVVELQNTKILRTEAIETRDIRAENLAERKKKSGIDRKCVV